MRGWYWPTRNLLVRRPDRRGRRPLVLGRRAEAGPFSAERRTSARCPKVDPILEVYDTNGYKLRPSTQGGIGEGESLRNFGVRGPAKYLLRLRSKYENAGNPDVPFDLMTELLPYQGRTEFEPNNQRADATPFELDSIQGTIAPAGDVGLVQGLDLDRGEVPAARGAVRRARHGPDADAQGLPRQRPRLLVDNAGKEQPEVLTG